MLKATKRYNVNRASDCREINKCPGRQKAGGDAQATTGRVASK